MWKCRKCNTENPNQSSYCQTCGEREEEIKGFTAPVQSENKIKEMTVDKMYVNASQKLPSGDYFLLELYAKIALGIGVAAIIVFVVQIFVTIGDFNFMSFLTGLIVTTTVSISCFITANLIELIINLKSEVNYSAQSNYVANRINKELLETLKEIQEQLNK